MLRTRLLPVASFVTPIMAASLLLPSVALASPYANSVPLAGLQDPGGESLAQPIPGQTPTRVEPQAQPQVQAQTPGAQTQTTPDSGLAGPQAQTQTLTVPAGQTPVAQPGGVVMQPQIQVLVQPQIQVQAQPQGNASPTSSADIKTTTNTTQTPETHTNTRVAPQTWAPPPQVRHQPQARYVPAPPPPRVVTRVVSRPINAPPPNFKRPPPPRKGLMITGWVLFGVSYLITASNAADLYDRCDGMKQPGRCRDLAENMFIPVVGPFLAMEQARYATDDFSLAVAGSLQGMGLLMGIIGTVQHHRDKYRNRVLNEYGVRVAKNASVAPTGRLGGGQLTLTARF